MSAVGENVATQWAETYRHKVIEAGMAGDEEPTPSQVERIP